MAKQVDMLYACCPTCGKPIGRSKRCDGMELICPKCGTALLVVVGQNADVSVKLMQPPSQTKTNLSSAAI